MKLEQFVEQLGELLTDATAAFESAADEAALEAARIEFLGAKAGRLKTTQKGLGTLDKADKPAGGKELSRVKAAIEAARDAATERLAAGSQEADVEAEQAAIAAFDPTIPGTPTPLGHLHPITQTIQEISDIMGRLGFTVAEGPEVEDRFHNFEALNIPLEHPARDPLDNFYLAMAEKSVGSDEGWLLRSQTSTVQIRVMEQTAAPVRIVSLGRVYRPDTPDTTHVPMFHQIEGLLVDKGITMADLKSVLRLFGMSYFEDDVHIRFRPSFFPFTEPSVEMDMSWHGGWVEMGGAGMVDPNVLRAVGYDPEEVTGFAFGLGIERMCARRHGITDIREFFMGDVRFLHQF